MTILGAYSQTKFIEEPMSFSDDLKQLLSPEIRGGNESSVPTCTFPCIVLCALTLTFWNSRIGEIRLFVLLRLPGGFFYPFCYSADSLMGVIKDAALVVK